MQQPMKVCTRNLLFLLLICSLASCNKAPQKPPEMPPMPVQVSMLKEETIQENVKYLATLKSRKSVSLKPRVVAQVSRIYVQSGDHVPAGKLLISLESLKQQETVRSNQAASQASQQSVSNTKETLKSLQAQRESALADAKLAESQYKRYSNLHQEELISKNDLEKYANTYERSKSQIQALDAQIAAQKYEVVRSEKNLQESKANLGREGADLNYYSIRAPFAGTVGDIPVKIGDYVDPNIELTSVSDIGQLEVYVSVPADQALDLKLDMPVQLLSGAEEPVGEGKIFFISPRVDTQSQTVLVKASYNNAGAKLRSEQQVKCLLKLKQRPGIKIPTGAVSRFGNNNFVFVVDVSVKPNVVHQKPVKLGEAQDNSYPVLEGLKPGDQIVVAGIEKLSEGAKVAALKPKEPEAQNTTKETGGH
jgi:multidrug efflux pump subunit AcrA (membrane-fusion protein)